MIIKKYIIRVGFFVACSLNAMELQKGTEEHALEQKVQDWSDTQFKPLGVDAQSVVLAYTYLKIRFANEFRDSLTKSPLQLLQTLAHNTQRVQCFMDTQKNHSSLQAILNVIEQQEKLVPAVAIPRNVTLSMSDTISSVDQQCIEQFASKLGIDVQDINGCLSEGGLESYHTTLPKIIDVRSRFLETMKMAMPNGKQILFVMERIVDTHGEVDKEEVLKEMVNKCK